MMIDSDEDSCFAEEEFTRLYKKQLAKAQQQQKHKPGRPAPRAERSRSRQRHKEGRGEEMRDERVDSPEELRWEILKPCPKLDFQRSLPQRIRRLPIIGKKEEIIQAVVKNQFVLVTGDTGCGKSTQVPRLIYEYMRATGDEKSKIMIVQPRRLAVTNLHGIMSKQLSEQLVGYQIGMSSHINPANRIVFVTNGIFLQRLVHSTEFLQQYPFILLDEVHERDIDTDFILLTIKRVIRQHPRVRVVLMSATLDNELFRYYFAADHIDKLLTEENFYKRVMREKERIKMENREDDAVEYESDDNEDQLYKKLGFEFKKSQRPCPQINVTEPGSYRRDYYYLDTLHRLFGERAAAFKWGGVLFSEKYPSTNKELYDVAGGMVRELLDDHRRRKEFVSLLIFMPGSNEIERICESIRLFIGGDAAKDVEILQVYRNSLTREVSAKLEEVSHSRFKVIVATNIAESSITVQGVKYVVDFCLAKENRFDLRSKMEDLELVWTSKASCRQRAGRTGRVCDGVVIRMVEEKFYNALPDYSTPEIQRSSLDKLVLRIKLLHETDRCNIFADPGEVLGSAIQPPRLKNIDVSIKSLLFCGGLEARGDEYRLTELGRLYVDIPIDIVYCKLLVVARLMDTFEEILILVAMLSQSKNAVRRTSIERNYQKYYDKVENSASCDFTALIKLYRDAKQKGFGYSKYDVSLDIGNEATYLISDIRRRFDRKKLPILQRSWRPSHAYHSLADKLGLHEAEEKEFRFKMTIMGGFIENFLRVREAALDDRQEKRLRTMKKSGIAHRNTLCILRSTVLRRPEQEEMVPRVQASWRAKVEQATGIRNTELTLTLGLSYLHFSCERDLQKFAFLKYMEENRREYNPHLEPNSRSSRFSFPELLGAFGETDCMHVGRPVTMAREQAVFVESQSLNRLVVMNEGDRPKYLVCNNLSKTSSRMNARYTSLLLQGIPHLAALAHLMFYPFLAVAPSHDKSKYQWMLLKRSHRLPLPYELGNHELAAVNRVRHALRCFLSLDPEKVEQVGDFLTDLLELVYLPRREVQEEERWQQAYLNEVVRADPMLNAVYSEMKAVDQREMDEEIRQGGAADRNFMNELRGCRLNSNFFSGQASNGPSRAEIEESYLRWKQRKVREVESIELTAQNHETYLACGEDSCGLKICRLRRVGPVSQEIFRDLIMPERGNLRRLPFKEEDCHFCALLMSNYIDSEYETIGCANGHYLAIQVKGEHNFKILPFSQLLVLYPDGTPHKADFDKLDERFWKKNHQLHLEEKFRKRLNTYCFVCDEVMESFRDLEGHMKEERHAVALGQFKKNLAKPQQPSRMQEDSDDGY